MEKRKDRNRDSDRHKDSETQTDIHKDRCKYREVETFLSKVATTYQSGISEYFTTAATGRAIT